MHLSNKTVLITGANRGIGQALVRAFLKNGVKKIYAGSRNIAALPDFHDTRVIALKLDITDQKDVTSAARQAADVDLLVNNAGIARPGSITSGPVASIQEEMNTNFFGTLNMIQAFVPILETKGGAIATVSSIVGFAPMTFIAGYSASKAALISAIQSARWELKSKNIEVIGIFPGPVDTDINRGFDIPKASPESAADEIVSGISEGREEIFPDDVSKNLSALWKQNPKEMERVLTGSNS